MQSVPTMGARPARTCNPYLCASMALTNSGASTMHSSPPSVCSMQESCVSVSGNVIGM